MERMRKHSRREANAGAMPSQQARPRGGAQAEECDGTTRAAGDSRQPERSEASEG